MSILFSGDFHGNAARELESITKKSLMQKYRQEKYDSIRYHIILGDGGFLWPGELKSDIYNFKVLAYRSFPVLCVIGNHDPVLGISGLPEVDIGIGQTVYQIQAEPFVAYLKRGKVYTIDGLRILVLGGALSSDKKSRKPVKTWREGEYWTREEINGVFKLLETDNAFDCVISHTGPHHINKKLFDNGISCHPAKFNDEVAFLNEDIHERIEFQEWWCGHFHRDLYYYDEETRRGYQYLYHWTKILDRVNNRMVVYNEHGMTRGNNENLRDKRVAI